MDNFNLPFLLRAARLAAGLTQGHAARHIGRAGRSYICQVEAGRIEIRASEFLMLAKLYQMNLNEIIYERDKDKKSS